MIICVCANVNEEKIIESIKSGNDNIDSLIEDLDVCTGCCCCKTKVIEMIEKTTSDKHK